MEFIEVDTFDENINECAFSLFEELLTKKYQKQEENNIWINSKFSKINLLKNDYSGSFGEEFINQICINNNIPSIYNGTKNSIDGTYDILINNKKIEIKTSRIGSSSKTFQHDGLRNNGSDYYLFLDITPTHFYISILPHFDLSQNCEFIDKKAHLRKDSDNVYKFDLTEKQIIILIEKKYCIKCKQDMSSHIIGNFINSLIK